MTSKSRQGRPEAQVSEGMARPRNRASWRDTWFDVATTLRESTFMSATPSQGLNSMMIKTKETPLGRVLSELSAVIDMIFFAGLPRHFPLRKKLIISRSSTMTGAYWDLLQIAMAPLACVVYVLVQYGPSLVVVQACWITVIFMTAFFLLEMLLVFFISGAVQYLTDPFTYIDLVTLVPFFVGMYYPKLYDTMLILVCLRTVRLARIFKSFKWMKKLSGVQKQVVSLSITIFCVSFLAAAVMQQLESHLLMDPDCKYLNAHTGWQPSCTDSAPAAADCDCDAMECGAYYTFYDKEGEPTRLACMTLDFFNSFYFVIVTITSVGYGDISPTSDTAKIFVIIFVVAFFLVIPMSISKLQQLLSMTSPFRTPYLPQAGENHIIVCGHVKDAAKLHRFFSEFFHKDRITEEEFHAVVLCPNEPNEEVRALLQSELLVSRCTYVIGTAMAAEDLKRAHAEKARSMFFLCNSEIGDSKGATETEDATTVLRALSVSNFNSNLECLVQVLRPEERVILKDSDVDCILCLDEYKTLVQARNAVCPGFSTFVENIFQSVEDIPEHKLESMPPWYGEYLHGAGMELYFFKLPHVFISHCQYEFKTMAEMIFLKFGVMMLGCCNGTWDSIVFQPQKKNIKNLSPPYRSLKEFYEVYDIAMVMASDQNEAEAIGRSLQSINMLREMTIAMGREEDSWSCHKMAADYKSKMRAYNQGKSSSNHSVNYMMNFFRSAAVGTGFDYLECESDDDDALMDTQSTTYIGYSTYTGSLKEGGGEMKDEQEPETAGDAHQKAQMKGPRVDMLKSTYKGLPPGTPGGPKIKLAPKTGTTTKKSAELSTSLEVERRKMQWMERLEQTPDALGRPSCVIDSAQRLSNHVIVYGHDQYTLVFIAELRRPAVVGQSYHPIVIIADEPPKDWDTIKTTFNDVYFLRAGLARGSLTSKANVDKAYSMIFLTYQDSANQSNMDVKGMDALTLFAFLKIMQGIPKKVFCSLELRSAANMTALNATIVKRLRRHVLDAKVEAVRQKHLSRGRNNSAQAQAQAQAQGGKSSKEASELPLMGFSANNQNRRSFAIMRRGSMQVNGKVLQEEKDLIEEDNLEYRAEKTLWEQVDNYNIFPVFASARVFIPSSFETLLVQSFYVKLTPLICEKFVCGQLGQTFQQVGIPGAIIGRSFLDLYRVFLANNVMCIGLYRAPVESQGALIPYVYISPPPDAVVCEGDKAFVFGSHQSINRAVCQADFIRGRHSRFL